ncbi:hypothetical protein TRAPUB_11628 [Trametes pubescens]|uniref:Uncharacterized protein n=1 Tax=Trametes pubescens TaxID=154538 RepID=A0A1M2VW77_TRAPU|nr:hypothetical protein TRAPUB_11628 [Trametes pubescens]
MATHETDSSLETATTTPSLAPVDPVDPVVEAVAKASLQDEVAADVQQQTSDTPARPLRVYARYDILQLSKSPLIELPEGMPPFKEWFGDWNEQVGSKKETESSTNTPARDRRFRRDTEDGDSSRASFRSGLTQPSQMGNFRHQSIRTTERGTEKEVDKERERDLRDREGQERLRNLSDKYDRDRLALSSVSTLRNKDRDAAPHLTGTSTSRLGQAAGAGRRAEGREASKRKPVESSDDWRRGAEPNRAGREDRADNPRRDRETRDRPRSRARESSRPRREPSTTRRDRDRDREDRDRPRERRGDGDRDDRREKDDGGRRDRDDYPRRDWDDPSDRDRPDYGRRAKDSDRDTEDDPRRWRDDGRRDERVAARRERERGWDRFEDRDRERPSGGDERDARTRRGAGRDRRLGAADDGKDREDRRDRDRDREAEPAWMETYVPSTSGGGILGGKTEDGELDGIQAWKKGMKERERKEKGSDANPGGKNSNANGSSEQQAASSSESPMDEIQLFKLMMKREAQKKEDKSQDGQVEYGPPGLSNSSSLQGNAASDPAIITHHLTDGQKISPSQSRQGEDPSPRPPSSTTAASNGVQTLLTALTTDSAAMHRGPELASPSLDRSLEGSRVMGPRLAQAASQSATNASSPSDLPSSNTSPSTFNPPVGSRVLAFKTRNAANNGPAAPGNQMPPPGLSVPQVRSASGSSAIPPHIPDTLGNDMHFAGQRINAADPSRGVRSFSPLSNGSQPNLLMDDPREAMHLGQLNEGIRRASGSAAERAIFGIPGENAPPYNDMGGPQAGGFPPGVQLDPSGSGANYTNKGSRFAKFFDARTRDVQATGPRLAQQQQAPPIQPGHPHLRQEPPPLGGVGPPRGERTMEDIFAMLQSSSQGHRMSPQIAQPSRIPQVGNQFAQSNLELQILQQQQQHLHQQQLAQNNRLDSLYDSRIDDRNFVPDGLVPGLRPAPPRSRSRESGGILFNEQIDDPLHFNVQRLTQQRNMEQMFNNGPVPSMYAQQQAAMHRNGGLPMQQAQYRGASPISSHSQNPLQPPSQRLPPGLANLGGRPPHDPSQFLGAGVGMPGGGLHGPTPAQQVYNTFTQGGLGGFNGNPPLRGPPGPPNPLSVNPMGGLGPNSMELRAANQAQLLGIAQGNLAGAGLRGSGPGFGPQQGPGGQMSASHLAMRQQLQQQQQQQHIPPQMMAHLLPSHLQQQAVHGGSAQTTQDLMALLMGGHRE